MLHLVLSAGFVLAQEDPEPSVGIGSVLPLLLIGAAVWFVFFGPQRRKMKAMRAEQEELRNSLSFGDDIITIGGIHGRVTGTTEHDVTIDIGAGVEMRIARRAIQERISPDPPDEAE